MHYNDKSFSVTSFQPSRLGVRFSTRHFFKLSLVLIGILSVMWMGKKSFDQRLFPIRYVKTMGSAKYQVGPIIKKAIDYAKQEGQGVISLVALKDYLKHLSWIERIKLRHILPGTLIIDLKVREPIAVWQPYESDTGIIVQWIDNKGFVFESGPYVNLGHIPKLVGEAEQLSDLLNYYRGLDTLLQSQSLAVASVHLDSNHRCSVKLVNGIQLLFGHFNPYIQLQKLLEVHPSVLHQMDKIAILDLRYPTGMAVTGRGVAV